MGPEGGVEAPPADPEPAAVVAEEVAPAVDAGHGAVERPHPAAGPGPTHTDTAGAVATRADSTGPEGTGGDETGTVGHPIRRLGAGSGMVRNLDRHRPEGHSPGPGDEDDTAVGVGQGAGVGGDHITGQRHRRRPEAVVEPGRHGGGDIPGAEQPGQAGRHHFHGPDLVAGGGRGQHRRRDRGGQGVDYALHRQRRGVGR